MQTAKFDTLIRNGLIVDGTGGPKRYGDIGITDGRIVAVGRLADAEADEVIDAEGKIVAPGHVTAHAHHDAQLFWDPYCSNSGQHGVTTILNANCGFSIAPVRPADRERTMLMLSTTEQIPVEQQRSALPWDWETFPEFMERVRALPKGVNIMTYLPLNPLLVYVMGIDGAKSRRPTADEMAQMHRLINEAMDAGAVGISMSVMGMEGNSHVDFDGTAMPTDALHDDDVVEIARAVVERGEGIIQMLSQIQQYGNRPLSERVARMAKGSGARVIHNAFIPHDALPDASYDDRAWIDGLREEGLDITAGALINRGWVEAGVRELDTSAGQMAAVRELTACRTDEDMLRLFSDPDFVKRYSAEYDALTNVSGSASVGGQIVIDVGGVPELEQFLGQSLDEIAQQTGKSPIATLCDLAVRTNLKVQFKSGIWAAADPSQLQHLLASAGIASGVSDGGAHTKAFANGHYATEMLIWLVREEKCYSIEEMHHQLSLKVARSILLEDRGAILPGFWADLLIYDLDELYYDRTRYNIVHDMPNGDWRRDANAGGYSRILVNGITTFANDATTGATPGQVVRVTSDLGEGEIAPARVLEPA